MPNSFFAAFQMRESDVPATVQLYEEKEDARVIVNSTASDLLTKHYVGMATILQAGGFNRAADILRNSLPTRKRIQSGDLGEIVAVEFLHSETTFRSPLFKLRYKSDRNTPLHGNDIVALDCSEKPPVILKGECKSRQYFSSTELKAAVEQLDADGCRPRPASLAFITKRLYEKGQDEEAEFFRDAQGTSMIALQNVEHLVFVLCGNDPSTAVREMPDPAQKIRKRWCACVIVHDHSDFVAQIFSVANGA